MSPERYVARSKAGELVIRTNSKADAERYAEELNGSVIDLHTEKDKE